MSNQGKWYLPSSKLIMRYKLKDQRMKQDKIQCLQGFDDYKRMTQIKKFKYGKIKATICQRNAITSPVTMSLLLVHQC